MIDFILSKLGILLFAVTMAGLLLYFSGSVKDVFLSDETVQVSNIIAKQIKYMVESENLCASTRVILPKYIDIFGVSDKASFSSIYYYLDINVVPIGNSDNFVVFSIYNNQTKKQIALESFRTKSDVLLLSANNQPTNNISINPTDKQVIYMVKSKTVEGTSPNETEKTNIFFVNCKYNKEALAILGGDPFEDCYSQLKQFNKPSDQYPFFCVPLPSQTTGGS